MFCDNKTQAVLSSTAQNCDLSYQFDAVVPGTRCNMVACRPHVRDADVFAGRSSHSTISGSCNSRVYMVDAEDILV